MNVIQNFTKTWKHSIGKIILNPLSLNVSLHIYACCTCVQVASAAGSDQDDQFSGHVRGKQAVFQAVAYTHKTPNHSLWMNWREEYGAHGALSILMWEQSHPQSIVWLSVPTYKIGLSAIVSKHFMNESVIWEIFRNALLKEAIWK